MKTRQNNNDVRNEINHHLELAAYYRRINELVLASRHEQFAKDANAANAV